MQYTVDDFAAPCNLNSNGDSELTISFSGSVTSNACHQYLERVLGDPWPYLLLENEFSKDKECSWVVEGNIKFEERTSEERCVERWTVWTGEGPFFALVFGFVPPDSPERLDEICEELKPQP